MSRDFELYLDDMCATADKVLRCTGGADFVRFVDDEKAFDAVVRNQEIIGEATKHVPQQVQIRWAAGTSAQGHFNLFLAKG